MLDLFHAFIEYAKKKKSIFGKHNMQIYDLSSM